jgi:hypothetical protein
MASLFSIGCRSDQFNLINDLTERFRSFTIEYATLLIFQ